MEFTYDENKMQGCILFRDIDGDWGRKCKAVGKKIQGGQKKLKGKKDKSVKGMRKKNQRKIIQTAKKIQFFPTER